jgi:hypothetical protein
LENQNSQGQNMLNRRNIVAGMGAVVAAPHIPAWAQSGWSSPVIDMHFHMRPDPAANIAHQVGAGVTAANLLVRGDAAPQVAALQAQKPAMFPCWMASSDVTRPEAEQILTQAVKAGARGIGELKYHVDADGPEMRRMYDLCAELDVPVLIHFQEVGQASAAGTYNPGIKHFAPVIRQYHRTKFILHADAFWANVSADYDEKDPYPTGPVGVGPDQLVKHFGRGGRRQQGQRLARHALAADARRHAIGILRRAAALAVLAIAVAAEMQPVLVALQEVAGEGRIA